MGRGHTCHNLGSYEGFTQSVPSHMRQFLFGYHISLCYFFALQSGHGIWPHLEMCLEQSDLLPLTLNNGTVSGEMGS